MDPDETSAPAARGDRQHVFLHVGSPKTGTTFLQHVLWSQRDLAREQGLLLPLTSFHDHYLASIDVRELSYEPRYPPRAIGIWQTLVEEGQRFDGNVLVSHELFAGATAEQAVAAVEAWGDVDVHVVVTARDLVRQIPAEWQEHIKHRSSTTFSDFVRQLETHGPQADWFWTVQDYADICRRWGAAVPADRVHVVTVPPRGARPEALWERFAGLVGLDAAAFDLQISTSNSSLRAEQAELLRRVNARLGDRLRAPGSYPETVKEIFAQEMLAGRPGAHVALSGHNRVFAVERSRRIADELHELGVDVVGDLAELVPPAEEAAAVDVTDKPELTPADLLLQESVRALTELLDRLSTERGTARASVGALSARNRAARAELDALLAVHTGLREQYDGLEERVRTAPWRLAVDAEIDRRPRLRTLRSRYYRLAGAGRRWGGRGKRLAGRARRLTQRWSGNHR